MYVKLNLGILKSQLPKSRKIDSLEPKFMFIREKLNFQGHWNVSLQTDLISLVCEKDGTITRLWKKTKFWKNLFIWYNCLSKKVRTHLFLYFCFYLLLRVFFLIDVIFGNRCCIRSISWLNCLLLQQKHCILLQPILLQYNLQLMCKKSWIWKFSIQNFILLEKLQFESCQTYFECIEW